MPLKGATPLYRTCAVGLLIGGDMSARARRSLAHRHNAKTLAAALAPFLSVQFIRDLCVRAPRPLGSTHRC
jgi:hypothetical protein